MNVWGGGGGIVLQGSRGPCSTPSPVAEDHGLHVRLASVGFQAIGGGYVADRPEDIPRHPN